MNDKPFRSVILWVYGSKLMPPEWRAWECMALTHEQLEKKCRELYGRVPSDCVAHTVPEFEVPAAARFQLSNVLSQVMYAKDNGIEVSYLFESEKEVSRRAAAIVAKSKKKSSFLEHYPYTEPPSVVS